MFAALIVAAVSLVAAFAGIDLAKVSAVEWLVVLGACGVIYLVWSRTRLPRARASRVGFGVAIGFEYDKSSKRAQADLIQALCDNLTGSRLRYPFDFVELPKGLKAQLLDAEEAASFGRRTILHFVLYGRARFRDLPDGPAAVFDLNGVVRHAAIQKLVLKQSGQKFRAALPKRLVLSSWLDWFFMSGSLTHFTA